MFNYLKVYAWENKSPVVQANYIPMIWSNSFFSHDPEWFKWANINAENCVAALLRQSPGKRSLFFSWLLGHAMKSGDPKEAFRHNLINLDRDLSYLYPLAHALRVANIYLDYIVVDTEDEYDAFRILADSRSDDETEAIMTSYYGDSQIFANMPASVRGFTPKDYRFQGNPLRFAAFAAWNRWAADIKNTSLRRILIESKLFHRFTSSSEVKTFKASNWVDSNHSFPIFDGNNWPVPKVTLDGISSPACYIGDAKASKLQGFAKDPRWNTAIACINAVRSCMVNGEVYPWISHARWGGDEKTEVKNLWLYEQMINHFVRNGCRTYLLWNVTDHQDKEMVDTETYNILKRCDKYYTKRNYPEIAYDSDIITTGSFSTKYVDFLESIK